MLSHSCEELSYGTIATVHAQDGFQGPKRDMGIPA